MHTNSSGVSMKMPVLFIGHGSPMNAIEDNAFTRALRECGANLPRPRAVLMISAHWETQGTQILSSKHPTKINDFYGFPPVLSDLVYAPPGSPEMAAAAQALLPGARLSEAWGLDHGAWSVALHLFPQADVPIFQLSLNQALTPAQHYALGVNLRPLREQGVMMIGSGNICHNLRQLKFDSPPLPWNVAFDAAIVNAIRQQQYPDVINFAEKFMLLASQALPSDEHFLPLLYALGASSEEDELTMVYEGFELAAISLRSMMWQARQ